MVLRKIDSGYVPQQGWDVNEHYYFSKELDSGTFGVVWLAIHKKSGKERAIKVVPENQDVKNDWSKMRNETNILQRVYHPNLLHLVEYFETKDTLCIVTEFYKGRSLFDEVNEGGPFSEMDSAMVVRQLLSCTAYLHSNNIVHRDIKLENVMLHRPCNISSIKLIDFGNAIEWNPERDHLLRGRIGTPNYMAPEVLEGRGYNHKCDIWAIGVLTYILLSGQMPFEGDSNEEIFAEVRSKEINLSVGRWRDISQVAKNFVSRLLTRDFYKRPEAAYAA